MEERIGLLIYLSLAWLVLLTASCGDEKQRKSAPKISQETLININRQLVKNDTKRIKGYIQTHHLKMQMTNTGLWYSVEKRGAGNLAKKGDIIYLNYELRLLDGTLCYSSTKDGIKSFLVGQGGVESGLEEAVLMLRQGDKGKFILPPHLAHGLIGDENKIPAHSSIVYDLEVLKLETPQSKNNENKVD
jgi:FKBP-type peptidyl-prolyl cis-trans isomerase